MKGPPCSSMTSPSLNTLAATSFPSKVIVTGPGGLGLHRSYWRDTVQPTMALFLLSAFVGSEISHLLTPTPVTNQAPWHVRYIPCLTPHSSFPSLHFLAYNLRWRFPGSASSPLGQGFFQGGYGLVHSLVFPWPQEDSHDSGPISL